MFAAQSGQRHDKTRIGLCHRPLEGIPLADPLQVSRNIGIASNIAWREKAHRCERKQRHDIRCGEVCTSQIRALAQPRLDPQARSSRSVSAPTAAEPPAANMPATKPIIAAGMNEPLAKWNQNR